jgi:hypothetical protein
MCLMDSVWRFLFLGTVDHLDLQVDTILTERTQIITRTTFQYQTLAARCQNALYTGLCTSRTRRWVSGRYAVSLCHTVSIKSVIAVSIATRYGLDGPGIESWWERDFPHRTKPALGPTQTPIQWVPGLYRV